ncbi:hypothetical protein [Paremcibacter congregatus]|uniref:hypothetical protein n=1 Tax=Paremcibacter congregatus TaxID=2043170 RepID=UPI0030EE805B|tara:strand:- start:11849 stop:12715 length:867 start_codon:yes stop_codon:yes gene_type:complete
MTLTILFYLIFISQIFLLSYYFPKKIMGRIKYICAKYPPADYPKLYPGSAATKIPGHLIFYKALNGAAFLIGLLLLIWGMATGYRPEGHGEETIVTFYAVLQYASLILLSIWEFRNFKKMRQLNNSTTRTADLQPRRLFDFLSPGWFMLAAVLLLMTLVFTYTVTDFTENGLSDVFAKFAGPVLVNVYFLVFGRWFIYGRKLNPHQTAEDRRREITISVKSMVFTSIMISLFFIADEAVKTFDMAHLQPALWSVYFQLIGALSFSVMLHSDLIKNMDFSVYRKDASSL